MAKNATFASTSLQTSNILSGLIDYYRGPQIQLTKFKLPRRHGSKAVSRRYDERVIMMTGKIVGTSMSDLESRLDTVNLLMGNQSGVLDVDHISGTRRFNVTVDDYVIDPMPEAPAAAQFTIRFICQDPFGYDTSTTALSFSGMALPQTAATGTASLTIAGTMDALPIVTLTLNSGTGLTGGVLYLTNSNTNETLAIYRDFVALDVVVVNWATQIVTVNGTVVDAIGAFPSMPPGTVPLVISDGFTTRSWGITGLYTKRWR